MSGKHFISHKICQIVQKNVKNEYFSFGAKIQIQQDAQENKIPRIEFSYMESLEPKKAHKSFFFLLSWSVMQNTRQQRIHDLNFTLRHHKNYVIKGQFVCLLYADFENYSKHINIVTSFLSIIMQHTVFKYQLKKSHSIL